jgi:hypothetical protein
MSRLVMLAMAVAVACGAALSAHHSYAGFEITAVTVQVTVESLTIENPHSLIRVRDEAGERYVVVLPATNALLRRGFTLEGPGSIRELLAAGQRVTITGRLKRDDRPFAMLVNEIDHPSAGRIWGN